MRAGYFCFTAEYSGARKEREKEYEERSMSRDVMLPLCIVYINFDLIPLKLKLKKEEKLKIMHVENKIHLKIVRGIVQAFLSGKMDFHEKFLLIIQDRL
jgi:hypothetical protein